MITLAFDCSTGPTSVALATDVEVLASIRDPESRGQAERLLPLIEQTRAKAGVIWPAIDCIAVTLGPGSFTGVRIGLAAARGLALALRRPVRGFPTLEAIAVTAPGDGPTAIAVDARRGEIYAQCFDGGGSPSGPPEALAPEIFAARLGDGRWRLIGSGAALVLAAPHRFETCEVKADVVPDAAKLALLAATGLGGGSSLEPLYLRPPDAVPQANP